MLWVNGVSRAFNFAILIVLFAVTACRGKSTAAPSMEPAASAALPGPQSVTQDAATTEPPETTYKAGDTVTIDALLAAGHNVYVVPQEEGLGLVDFKKKVLPALGAALGAGALAITAVAAAAFMRRKKGSIRFKGLETANVSGAAKKLGGLGDGAVLIRDAKAKPLEQSDFKGASAERVNTTTYAGKIEIFEPGKLSTRRTTDNQKGYDD